MKNDAQPPEAITPAHQLCVGIGRRDGFVALYLDFISYAGDDDEIELTPEIIQEYENYGRETDHWDYPAEVITVEHGAWYYREGFRLGYLNGVSMLEALLRGKELIIINQVDLHSMLMAHTDIMQTTIPVGLVANPEAYSPENQIREYAQHGLVESLTAFFFARAHTIHMWATIDAGNIEEIREIHVSAIIEQLLESEQNQDTINRITGGLHEALDVLKGMLPSLGSMPFTPEVVREWGDRLRLRAFKYGPEKPRPNSLTLAIPREVVEMLMNADSSSHEEEPCIMAPSSATPCQGERCTVCGACVKHHSGLTPYWHRHTV